MEKSPERRLELADLPFKCGEHLIVRDNVTDIGREVNRILSEAGRPERMRLGLDLKNNPKFVEISEFDESEVNKHLELEIDGTDVTFGFDTNRAVFNLLCEQQFFVPDTDSGIFKIQTEGKQTYYYTEARISIMDPNPVSFEFRIKGLTGPLFFKPPNSWGKLIPVK
jgi:hypothetical protein